MTIHGLLLWIFILLTIYMGNGLVLEKSAVLGRFYFAHDYIAAFDWEVIEQIYRYCCGLHKMTTNSA